MLNSCVLVFSGGCSSATDAVTSFLVPKTRMGGRLGVQRGSRVDRMAGKCDVEPPCNNEECPVPRFEWWYDYYESVDKE